ncbi:MAG: hypothetical protein ACJATV_001708 [Granulosicoccus sp.]
MLYEQRDRLCLRKTLPSTFPEQLLNLPKLACVAFAPILSHYPILVSSKKQNDSDGVPKTPSSSLSIQALLGGVISTATWDESQNQSSNDIAVKAFEGEVTSDAYPTDELQPCLKASSNPNLTKPLAQVNEHHYLALAMELLSQPRLTPKLRKLHP